MKKTIQLISLAAAAGLIAGCSSTGDQSSANVNPTPGTAVNSGVGGPTEMTGNPAYNLNQGAAYNPPGAPGNNASATDLSIDQLPQAAQTTIRNQIGDQQIAKIKAETKDGQTAYKVELQKKDFWATRPTLTVAADGSILKESHMQKINEASGSQAPQNNSDMQNNNAQGTQNNNSQAPQSSGNMGSQANPSGSMPNSSAGNQNQ